MIGSMFFVFDWLSSAIPIEFNFESVQIPFDSSIVLSVWQCSCKSIFSLRVLRGFLTESAQRIPLYLYLILCSVQISGFDRILRTKRSKHTKSPLFTVLNSKLHADMLSDDLSENACVTSKSTAKSLIFPKSRI